ncbi:hypothetical protein C8R44DRAFT_701277 [Mycena epipterygia]|nr:hypothetical protein C8R44DRAFT_701277 [Mycena epipterygia]
MEAPSSTAASGIQIVQVSGPLFIGFILHWGLFGTLTTQLYLYYQAFPRDRLFNKALVYTIYAIEFVQTILITHDGFLIFGYGFLDISALTKVNFDWLTVPIMGGLVAFIGQSFYAYRVYVVSKSLSVPLLIVVVSLTSSVGAFIAGGFTFQAGDITLLTNRKTSIAVGVWCGGSALSDIIIAACMTYYLTKHDTKFRQTQVLLSELTRLIIETGSLTALVALVNLALFLALPHNLYYTTPGGILPKLYANTILVVLNSRFHILGGRETHVSTTSDTLSATRYGRNRAANSDSGQPSFIEITREVFSDGNSSDHVEMKAMRDCHGPV